MMLTYLLCLSLSLLLFSNGRSYETDESWVYLSSEVSMPRVGFGSCGLRNTGDMVCTALKSGVKMIDSAQAREWYNEGEVGKSIQNEECRAPDDLVVVTKIHPRSYELQAMRKSLEQSSVDLYHESRKLDVVLLHAPFCWEGHCNAEQAQFLKSKGWYTAWRNLEQMHDEGLVAAIGVSNFGPEQLQELLSFANKRVAVVQNFMDPFNQDKAVRAICRDHNIAYMAYSTLGNQWRRRSNPVFKHPLLQSIAEEHHSSVASVVLHWALYSGAIVIPKSSKAERVESNAKLLTEGRVSLTAQNMIDIGELDGSIGKPWDEIVEPSWPFE